jgi:hypothetical protein
LRKRIGLEELGESLERIRVGGIAGDTHVAGAFHFFNGGISCEWGINFRDDCCHLTWTRLPTFIWDFLIFSPGSEHLSVVLPETQMLDEGFAIS